MEISGSLRSLRLCGYIKLVVGCRCSVVTQKEEKMLQRIMPALALVVIVVGVALAIASFRRAPAVSDAGCAAAPTVAGAAAAPTAAIAEPAAMPAPTAVPAPLPEGPAAPGFDGGGAWINSEPLALADLNKQGKVVLVDFWTYGCYNCANTLPYVKQWWQKYKDQGLVIVGVHTPRVPGRIQAGKRAGRRPGAGDRPCQSCRTTTTRSWRAYGNHYWPLLPRRSSRADHLQPHWRGRLRRN